MKIVKYSLQAENLTVTEADKLLLEKKIGRLKKLLQPPYMTDIRFLHDTHHSKGEVVNCIVNVHEGKTVFHSERTGDSMQQALDECLQAIKREIERKHGKRKIHGFGFFRNRTEETKN